MRPVSVLDDPLEKPEGDAPPDDDPLDDEESPRVLVVPLVTPESPVRRAMFACSASTSARLLMRV